MFRWSGWILFAAMQLAWAEDKPRALTAAIIQAPPYGQLDERKQAAGLYPDLIAQLSARAAVPIHSIIVPFARAANLVANGGADLTLMFATGQSQGAEALLPVLTTSLVLQTRPGLVITNTLQLKGKLIGRIRGGCQTLEADPTLQPRFHELEGQEQGIKMLLLGRIDAFCTAEESLALAKASIDREQRLRGGSKLTIGQREVWLFVRPQMDPALKRRLMDTFRQMRDDGSIARLRQHYLGR